MLIFFKYYDPKNNYLTYCGHGHFSQDTVCSELLPFMCDKAGLPESTPLLLFEEEYLNCVNRILDLDKPLKMAINELMDGDIIVFQRDYQEDTDIEPLLSIKDFYGDLLHRVEVLFCDKNNSNDPGFVIELSLKMNYNQIANAVAMRLGTDPYLIQFFKNQRYFFFVYQNF